MTPSVWLVKCPSCSAEVPADARFCPSCGHLLNAPGDERRVVTVLFGDIVGFTGLSERRDPEQVKNLVDRCFARLTADIRTFGGTLDKVVGDALVALFGAPVAHEDDAERAVRAALQMQETLAGMVDTLGVDVQMRIGINTGEVLVGALRAGGDYTAMGDVVNTASRLQTMAEPGRIVVGPQTHAATATVVRYEPLGLLQPRGRESAIEAWVAVEALLQPGGRPPRRVSSRLVGRDLEFGLLNGAVTSALTGRRPTLIVLVGEAGVGKSRLAEEVVLRAMGEHHAKVLTGRSVPYAAANAWWPIAEVMRAACGVGPEDSAEQARSKCSAAVADAIDAPESSDEVGRIVEGLLYLIGIGASLVDVETQRAQDEVARSVRTFIEGLASKQPLIVSIGDVQWADPSVLLGLDDLLGRLHRVPIVVILTGRPELETIWSPATGHQNLIVLHLDPLDAEATGDLLISLLGRDPGPRSRSELVERSGGNPLFVEELAALLADDEPMAGEGDEARPLPATLRGIVAARLDALPPRERAVLDDAAVVGRRAPMAVLDALGASRGSVTEAVDELVGKDLLVVEDGQCEFRSDLVREVVYGMLTKAERGRRHAHLAGWLETPSATSTSSPSDELLGEVARHWATAAELWRELAGIEDVPPDVVDRAVAALEMAGERAEDRELHVAVIRLYDRLIGLLGDESSLDRRHAYAGRARAAAALRRDEAANADVEVAESDARAAGDDATLALALTVRGDLLRNAGDYEQSLAMLGEALQLWRAVGNRRGEGSALRRIGWTKLFSGDLAGAEPVMLEALEAFRQAGALRGQAWAHQNLAWAAYGRGDPELAERRLQDSIALFRQIGDWGGLNWTTGMVGWVRLSQARVAEAETSASQALVEAQDQGDTWQVAMMEVLLAAVRLWQGRAGDAVDLGRSATRRFEEMGDEWGRAQAIGPLSRALLATGRFEEVERLTVAAAARTDTSSGLAVDQYFPRVAEVYGAVALGRPEAALAALADDPTAPGDARFGSCELLVDKALALLQLGRIDESVKLLSETIASTSPIGSRGLALAALALALCAQGRVDEALTAAAEVQTMEVSYLERVLASLAEACALGRRGDAEGADRALDQATRLVGTTQDRLTDAVVALARARVLGARGDRFAGGAEADARQRLGDLGIAADGWDRALGLAAGGIIPEGTGALAED